MTTDLTTRNRANPSHVPADGDALRCVTYLRVSSREQAEEGYSIAAQRETCLRFIADHGWSFVDEYCDSGESARTADRPQFQAMLERLAQDRSIGCLVVHKLDRLARNLEDHVTVRARLRALGVRLVSVTESIEESASGKLVEGILASIAEFYSANLSQEIRKGLTQKAKEGRWPTLAPLGYRNVRHDGEGRRGESTIVQDDERAPLVRQAFELYATGELPLAALADQMARRGLRNGSGRPLTRSRLGEILHNPVYAGKVVWKGVEYVGVHEPLVTEKLFERVQEVFRLHDRAGERQRRHPHYLRGTLFCGSCGRRLSSLVAKGRFPYFFCTTRMRREGCEELYAAAGAVEHQLEERYRAMRLTEDLRAMVAAEIEDEVATREQQRTRSVRFWTQRIGALDAEKDKLLRAYYADALPLELLEREQARIDAEAAQARDELERARARLHREQELVEVARALMDNLHNAYRRASAQTRRRFNQALVEAAYVKDRRVVRVTYREPFARRPSPPGGGLPTQSQKRDTAA